MLPPHNLKIVLMQPQIAPNTGNIGRLCVATGAELHLVRPLGFVLDDRNLKRSGMDYWPRVKLFMHDDADSFFRAEFESIADSGGRTGTSALKNAADAEATTRPLPRFWLFTTKSSRSHWSVDYQPDDFLIFGSETHGLDERLLHQFPDQTVRIPQVPDERCLNLSTAVGIGLYEALRRFSC